MWITMDDDGPVVLHENKPALDEDWKIYLSIGWTAEITERKTLYEHLGLTFENSPKEVELTIKK